VRYPSLAEGARMTGKELARLEALELQMAATITYLETLTANLADLTTTVIKILKEKING